MAAATMQGEARGRLGRAYWRMWTASTASGVGDGLVSVALPLAVAVSTRSAGITAGVLAVGRLPWLVCSIPAGVVADRVDRGRLMVAVDAARAVVVGTVGIAMLAGRAHWPLLYAGAFLLGALETLFSASAHAAVPALVEKDQLERANGWLMASETAGHELAGPAVGGVLFALMGAVPFLADAVSFVVSAVMLRTIRRQLPAPTRCRDTRFTDDLREGVQFFRQSPLLRRLALFVSCLASCQSIVMAVLVIFVLRTLHLGPAGYGILLAVGALGNVVGAAVAPQLREAIGSAMLVLVAAVAAAVSYLGIAMASSPTIVALFILVECLAVGAGNVVTVSLRQAIVPDELLGRVGNVFRMIVTGAIPVAAIAGGWMAGTFGLRVPFAVAAVVQLTLVAVLGRSMFSAIAAVDGARVVAAVPRPVVPAEPAAA